MMFGVWLRGEDIWIEPSAPYTSHSTLAGRAGV